MKGMYDTCILKTKLNDNNNAIQKTDLINVNATIILCYVILSYRLLPVLRPSGEL